MARTSTYTLLRRGGLSPLRARRMALRMWWHSHPNARMFAWGFCNPSYPVHPWKRGVVVEAERIRVFYPVSRQAVFDAHLVRAFRDVLEERFA